jgi:hypothetical protein
MDRVGFEPTTSVNTLQQSKKKADAGELLYSQYPCGDAAADTALLPKSLIYWNILCFSRYLEMYTR